MKFPDSVAAAANGAFYAASGSENRVYRVERDGTVKVVAGTGKAGFSGDGGPAISADLNNPQGIAVDAAGNLFIVDAGNSRVRQVTAGGNIRTIAGNGNTADYRNAGDGSPATSMPLDSPRAIAVDQAGNVFVSTSTAIRKITPGGSIRTVAGGGSGRPGDGGPATSAYLSYASGIAVDGAGNLIISDFSNKRIRKVTPTGIISTVVDESTVQSPQGVAVDAAGNLFIADVGAVPQSAQSSISVPRIWKRTPDGTIRIVAGGIWGFAGDGGSATAARIGRPRGIAVTLDGTLYIADGENNRIRKVTTAGVITTVLGDGTHDFSGDGGPASSAQLNWPAGIAMDAMGNLYIADSQNARVRKVTPAGTISTIAGIGVRNPIAPGATGDGGPATSAEISVDSVAVDGSGNVFIAGYDRVRKVAPNGIITTVAGPTVPATVAAQGGVPGISGLIFPSGVAVDAAGNLFIADGSNNRVLKVTSNGSISIMAGTGNAGFSGDGGPATAAQLHNPRGLAVDGIAGNLFVVDADNHRVRKITPSGTISTVAGRQDFGPLEDGVAATSAYLSIPRAIAVDQKGNIYISSDSTHIQRVSTDGIIHTVAGNGKAGFSGDGGAATAASLNYPQGIAVDAAGNVSFADGGNNRIRKLTPARDPQNSDR